MGPRILLIRTSALGDIVHALPVLSELRRTVPGAHIGWVVEDVFAPLLEDHPDLDRVLPVRLRSWRHRLLSPEAWRETGRFLADLHEFSADIVLDLMGSHKAGVIAAATMADRRLGLAREYRRERSSSLWLSESFAAHGEHAVDHMLSVLQGLSPQNDSHRVDFAGDRLPSKTWSEGPTEKERFVLLHPRTAWRNKDYRLEDWAEVVRQLSRETGLATWVGWGPGEQSDALELEKLSEGAARSLPELLSLPELVAISRAASLVLGGDTGPIHLAHAVGTPVVCVMGPTDPLRNGPYGSRESAIFHRLACSFCYQRLESTKPCLLEIRPAQVAELGAGKVASRASI